MDPIAPITGLIDKIEDLMGHSPHPAIVAVPLGAWTVSNVCDTLALVSGDDRFDDAARISMAIGLAGAAAAVVTGLRDYSMISKDSPSHDVATSHGIGNAVVSTMMAASYIMRAKEHAGGRGTSVIARLLGLGAGGLSLYTAWLGGVLVEEMGVSVKPVQHLQDVEDGHGREPSRRIPRWDFTTDLERIRKRAGVVRRRPRPLPATGR